VNFEPILKMDRAEYLANIMTGIRVGRLENRGSILDEKDGIIIFASISKLEIWADPVS